MKKCPYCAELVHLEAKKCKHCGEWIEKESFLKKTLDTISNEINTIKEDYVTAKTQHLHLAEANNPLVVKHVKLYPHHIQVNGETIPLINIVQIYIKPYITTHAFVTKRSLAFYIGAVKDLKNLQDIQFYNLSSNDDLIGAPQTVKKKEYEVYGLIYGLIEKQTFLSRLLNTIETFKLFDGFFHENYLYENNGDLKKFNGGSLKYITNLLDAFEQNNLTITPNTIYFTYKTKNFLNFNVIKNSNIETDLNTDVYIYIIKYLVKYKELPTIEAVNKEIATALVLGKKDFP